MEHKIYSLWCHVFLGEDICGEVARIQGIVAEDVRQVQAGYQEVVCRVVGLGVVVSGHDHRVSPSCLLHKLVDLEHLAVSLARVQLLTRAGVKEGIKLLAWQLPTISLTVYCVKSMKINLNDMACSAKNILCGGGGGKLLHGKRERGEGLGIGLLSGVPILGRA